MICRICGSDRAHAAFSFHAYQVAHCEACTGEFLEPQPTDDVLAGIYTEDYFFAQTTDAERDRHAYLKSASARKTLGRLGGTAGSGARLLDIGCGTGDFLREAVNAGYAVTGVEFSPSSAATAAARVSGTVIQGTLESAAFADGSFDVVASSDVIEHVRDPLSFAREVRRILKPGGVAIISTPDLDSWSHRLLGRRWVEYKIEHLLYFNHRSLELLLREAGFTQIELRPHVKVLSASYIVAHFRKFPIPFWTRLLTGLERALPEPLLHRSFPIVASGVSAIAR